MVDDRFYIMSGVSSASWTAVIAERWSQPSQFTLTVILNERLTKFGFDVFSVATKRLSQILRLST